MATGSGLDDMRVATLGQRLTYALGRLDRLPQATLATEFRELLTRLALLAQLPTLRQSENVVAQSIPVVADSWLTGGWQIIAHLTGALAGLSDYRALTSVVGRRRLLESTENRVRSLSWDGLPRYWQQIGRELANHWVSLLTAEARQARERLRLDVEPLAGRFAPGSQTLRLQIRNPSTEPARGGQVRVEPAEGLTWVHPMASLDLLEGGQGREVRLDFRAEREGTLRIAGHLEAQDLDDEPFSLPFAFQIQIARAGRSYQPPSYQPFQAGEGLGSERTFAGRANLLDWLRGLWLQPDGKPAVVLVGQRRIGKTSLLNKVERDGLPGTGLLAVVVNIQGVGSQYDFLSQTAGRMAALLELPEPELDRGEPYAAFKGFLKEAQGPLGDRRFLLMLDEADLIPERRLGDLLPGFLRALMQEPQYPVVMLFCGTTRLRAMAREYFSILFNTAQFRTVSYLTETESAEVLCKPTRDILDFDPLVLSDVYRLTRGQPLLLQMIGAALINAFNDELRRGKERSNYVDTKDLERAVKSVVRQQTNVAFENHWGDSDPATHRVLSALAWATDEQSRRQLDLNGIEWAMGETRLPLTRQRTFHIVERLADDEVLARDGPTYRFWVPLYRRWVAWRWPPERVREEMPPG